METIRFREKRKTSYKFQIFSIALFLIIGSGIIIFAISHEEEPVIIGQQQSDIATSANIDESNALKEVEESEQAEPTIYEVTDKTISDRTNKKIKANIKVPVIKINDKALESLNEEIYNKFNDTYKSFKDVMKDVDNNFTYTVTYKVYNNTIGNRNIVSITIYERMIDDAANNESMEKIHAYNIDLKDGTVLEQEDVALEILGGDYKDKIKAALKDYCIGKKMIKENDYVYSYTGLEKYYIKNNKFHLLFNPDELADKKYSILDIVI